MTLFFIWRVLKGVFRAHALITAALLGTVLTLWYVKPENLNADGQSVVHALNEGRVVFAIFGMIVAATIGWWEESK